MAKMLLDNNENNIELEKKKIQSRLERNHINKKRTKHKLLIISPCIILLSMYLAGVVYFSDHLFFRTSINNINVSAMTIEEAFKTIEFMAGTYKINIYGRNNLEDNISGDEINFKVNDDAYKNIQRIKDNQNSFLWIKGIFKNTSYEEKNIFTIDDNNLEYKINNLEIINKSNNEEPKEPGFQYSSGQFHIVSEIQGDTLIPENLYENIRNAILFGRINYNISDTNSYKRPKFTKDSSEVREAEKIINKYKDVNLTYVFDDGSREVINGERLIDWLEFNENFQIHASEEKIYDFINNLNEKYKAPGAERPFKTSDGRDIIVGGGDYGSIIDVEAERQAILNILNMKGNEEREPIYSKRSYYTGLKDIGNTYVEVDLGNQHLWFYKNGSLIIDGDIVSGNMLNGNGTPGGIYSLKSKELNAVLIGENYRTPVSFWMPFNEGIGIHDATWRYAFGGNIYYGGGSHGCVNAPYTLAETIFNNIEEGTPIVCYY